MLTKCQMTAVTPTIFLPLTLPVPGSLKEVSVNMRWLTQSQVSRAKLTTLTKLRVPWRHHLSQKDISKLEKAASEWLGRQEAPSSGTVYVISGRKVGSGNSREERTWSNFQGEKQKPGVKLRQQQWGLKDTVGTYCHLSGPAGMPLLLDFTPQEAACSRSGRAGTWTQRYQLQIRKSLPSGTVNPFGIRTVTYAFHILHST